MTCVVEGCLFIISGCIPTYVALLTHKNPKPTNRYQLSRSGFSKQSQGREKWTGLDSVGSSERKDKVKITTDIITTFEEKD